MSAGDDLLARIDQDTEAWDTWDGRGPDTMRWQPEPRQPDLAEVRAFAQAYVDAMALAFARISEVVRPAVQALVELQTQQAETKRHQVPMWATQPNRERRR